MKTPMPTEGGSYLRDTDGALIRRIDEDGPTAAPATSAEVVIDQPLHVPVTIKPIDPPTPRKGGK